MQRKAFLEKIVQSSVIDKIFNHSKRLKIFTNETAANMHYQNNTYTDQTVFAFTSATNHFKTFLLFVALSFLQ